MKNITKKILSTFGVSAIGIGTIAGTTIEITSCSFSKKENNSFRIDNLQDIYGDVGSVITPTNELQCYDLAGNLLANGTEVTYSAINLAGLDINPQTGVISGTPIDEKSNEQYLVTATYHGSKTMANDIKTQSAWIDIEPAEEGGVSETSKVFFMNNGDLDSIDLVEDDISILSLPSMTSLNLSENYPYNFSNGTIIRNQLTGIVFGEQFLKITSLPDNFCAGLFRKNQSEFLNVDFAGLKNVDSVGNYFAAEMFNTTLITSLPTGFNLPQEITEVGDHFARYMFGNTKLESLPTGFNFPPNITKVGSYFADFMFYRSENISLPTGFNFPQEITEVGDYFAEDMFCYSKITSLPSGFNFPQGIIKVGESFGSAMFSESQITSLPTGFNLPPNITEVGDYFANALFNKSQITSLPTGFNLPQKITEVGNGFARLMFGSAKLESLPTGFNLPPNITEVGSRFASELFYGSQITSLPGGFNFPQGIIKVGNNFANYMFRSAKLESLPTGFNFPPNITEVGNNFAGFMFEDCENIDSSNNKADALIFPNISNTNFGSYTFLRATLLNAAGVPTNASPGGSYNIARS